MSFPGGGNVESCCKCEARAVWMYAPSTQRIDIFFCDEHVPRGCTCNDKVLDPMAPLFHPDSDWIWVQRDSKGRVEPCVEYWHDSHGWEKDKWDD